MKKIAILAVSLLALPATADNPRFMQAVLDGYQEVPSVATRASGIFTARPNSERTEVEYSLTYSNMSSNVLQAHIHFAQIGVNGAIIVW